MPVRDQFEFGDIFERAGFDAKDRAEGAKDFARWEKSLKPLDEGIQRSAAVSEDDFKIRINVRDDE